MFAQSFFTPSPLGSTQMYMPTSYYSEPAMPWAQRLAQLESPLGFGQSAPVYRRQPTYRRPAFRNAYYDEESSEESESDEEDVRSADVCTCGKCYPRVALPTLNQSAPAVRHSRAPPASTGPSGLDRLRVRTTAPAMGPATSPVSRASSSRNQQSAPGGKASPGEVRSPSASTATVKEDVKPEEPTEAIQSNDIATAESLPQGSETAANEPSPRTEVDASLSTVASIAKDISAVSDEVDVFAGAKESKLYLRLEDTLTRILLRLDMVESFGDDGVRLQRREAVRSAQACLDVLESKVASPAAADDQSPAEESAISNVDTKDSDCSGDEEAASDEDMADGAATDEW